MAQRRPKPKSTGRGVNPSKKRAFGAASSVEPGTDDADARRRLSKYLLGVIENDKAHAQRRDEMAICLSKMLSTTRGSRGAAVPKAPTQKQPPKPRESTYASKKRQAEVDSRTAQKNSHWEGLINGGARAHDDDDAPSLNG